MTWRQYFYPIFGIALFLFGLGVVLRVVGFGTVPVSIYWDEMAMWNDALSIAATGLDMHARPWYQLLFISYGDFKMPVYIWFTSVVTHLTRNPVAGVRIVSLLAGISTLITVPLLAREVHRRFVPASSSGESSLFALCALLVVSVLPLSLHFSRVGFEGHLGMALLTTAVLCVVRASGGKKWWTVGGLMILGAVTGSAAMLSYFSVRFVWPGLLIGILLLTIARSQTRRQAAQHFLVVLVALVVAAITFYSIQQADFASEAEKIRFSTVSALNDPSLGPTVNQYRQWAGNDLFSRGLYFSEGESARQIWTQGLSFVSPAFLFLQGDPNLRHGTGVTGILWWWMAPFLVSGLITLFRRSRGLTLFLLLWWGLAILPGAVPTEVPHALRSLNSLPPLVLFTAWGGVSLIEILKSWWNSGKRTWPILLSIGMVLAIGFSLVQWVAYQPVYARQSTEVWQDGYLQLGQYLRVAREEYPKILITETDSHLFLYYQPWSDLTWSEIQELPSDGFKRQDLGKISFEQIIEWDQVSSGTLVIVEPGEEYPPDFPIRERIYNTKGEEVFLAVEALATQSDE